MSKVLLSISYDGTDFCGWQRQKNARSVQQVLEDKLSQLMNEEIKLVGCSRTDAGVHALDQKATFSTRSKIPLGKLPSILNSRLPLDIFITAAVPVADDFHPRYQALKKRYRYSIQNSDYIDIRDRRFYWHIRDKLNPEAMQEACKYLIGKQNFATFCAAGSQVASTVRTVFKADVGVGGSGGLYFTIEGDGFLYKMVRIIVGTLVDIGMQKTQASAMAEIIAAKSRKAAMRTAPPNGLCLEKVWYYKEKQHNNLT